MKQPFGIRILSWFVPLASAGMFVSIALATLDIGPHLMGGEKSNSLGMVAHRRPARCGDRLPHGLDRVRSRRAQSMVATSRDGDVYTDNHVCIHARRAQCASAHDYVACHR